MTLPHKRRTCADAHLPAPPQRVSTSAWGRRPPPRPRPPRLRPSSLCHPPPPVPARLPWRTRLLLLRPRRRSPPPPPPPALKRPLWLAAERRSGRPRSALCRCRRRSFGMTPRLSPLRRLRCRRRPMPRPPRLNPRLWPLTSSPVPAPPPPPRRLPTWLCPTRTFSGS